MSTTEFNVGDEVINKGVIGTIVYVMDSFDVFVKWHITGNTSMVMRSSLRLHRSFKSILVGEVGEDIVPDLHYDRVQVEEEIRVNLLKLIYLKEREDV